MIGVRKRLSHTVICDRDCRMSPVMRTFYDIFYFRLC